MPLSRRSFLTVAGGRDDASPSSAFMAARGREAAVAEGNTDAGAAEPALIRISSNENPLGPGPTAVQAFVRAFQDAGRYPTNARPSMGDLRDTIYTHPSSTEAFNDVLGVGLREAVEAPAGV